MQDDSNTVTTNINVTHSPMGISAYACPPIDQTIPVYPHPLPLFPSPVYDNVQNEIIEALRSENESLKLEIKRLRAALMIILGEDHK